MTFNERISPVAAILLAGGLATAVSMGVRSTMGVYLDPITVDSVSYTHLTLPTKRIV